VAHENEKVVFLFSSFAMLETNKNEKWPLSLPTSFTRAAFGEGVKTKKMLQPSAWPPGSPNNCVCQVIGASRPQTNVFVRFWELPDLQPSSLSVF